MSGLKKLFEPVKIGPIELHNRIVMEGISLITEDTAQVGYVHQKYIDYYEERARGGAGLIILGDTLIERKICMQSQLSIEDAESIPGLSALADSVHMWGAKIAPDLCHFGYRIDKHWCPGLKEEKDYKPVSSSPLEYYGLVSRAMTIKEIEDMEDQFAQAALRAKQAGYDAVQLAGQFGFLIAQFLSPRFNARKDRYGGSLDNRLRFALEIIAKVRALIGKSVPIIFRISADEFIDGGLRIEDTKVISRRLQDAGVDALNIIAGVDLPGKLHKSLIPMGYPQGPFVELGAQIKKVVDIPVIIAGRITDPMFAERIIEEGKADIVGMARQLHADPEWPNKAADGRFKEIVPCIGCNVCIQRLLERRVSRCSVNAAVGREREMKILPAVKPLKVAIIGGGPAGMESARIAAMRGFKVTLFEKNHKLGGQLLLSTKPPHKDELKQYLDYLISQVKKYKVELRLGVEMTPEIIRESGADIVILATGAIPCIPDIKGINNPGVVTAWEVLSGKETGSDVIIAGGGLVGCETAEYLIERGKRVTLVEMLPEIAFDVEITNRSALLERFENYDINTLVKSRVASITKQGVIIERNGKTQEIAGDNVIIAMGSVPGDSLKSRLGKLRKPLYVIGDCARPARIVDAVNQASYVARKI